jgi:hypothetical protein
MPTEFRVAAGRDVPNNRHSHLNPTAKQLNSCLISYGTEISPNQLAIA